MKCPIKCLAKCLVINKLKLHEIMTWKIKTQQLTFISLQNKINRIHKTLYISSFKQILFKQKIFFLNNSIDQVFKYMYCKNRNQNKQ